jgi:hypothetical protein
MKKSLREKLISLNGKKVRLITTHGERIDILKVIFIDYQNGNGRKEPTMNVSCGWNEQYNLPIGIALKNIIDVEEM